MALEYCDFGGLDADFVPTKQYEGQVWPGQDLGV